jgi:hypothetical protein
MQVHSVIELGCGDGHQLGLARYPLYLGLDVSAGAIDLCLARFAGDATKSFLWYDPRRTRHPANFITADLALSLDVVYHLLEDEVYDAYLGDLFAIARRFVIIYSSDRAEGRSAPHVRHRKFTDDVALRIPEFQLVERIPNRYPAQSFAEFFIFERTGSAPATDAAPVAAGAASAASAASAAPTVAHKDPRSAPRSPRG